MSTLITITTARDARLNYLLFNHDAGRTVATQAERDSWGGELIRSRPAPSMLAFDLLELSRLMMSAVGGSESMNATAGASAVDDEGREYSCGQDGAWTTNADAIEDFGTRIVRARLPNGALVNVRRPAGRAKDEPHLIVEMAAFAEQMNAAMWALQRFGYATADAAE